MLRAPSCLLNLRIVDFWALHQVVGIIGLGFAIGETSLEVASCPLFDMALCFPIGPERKLLKWLQENIEKLIMLNKRRR